MIKSAPTILLLLVAGCASTDTLPAFQRTQIEITNMVAGRLVEEDGCVRLVYGDQKPVLAWMQGTRLRTEGGRRLITDHRGVTKAIGDQVTIVGGDAEASSFSSNPALSRYLARCGGRILSAYRFLETDNG